MKITIDDYEDCTLVMDEIEYFIKKDSTRFRIYKSGEYNKLVFDSGVNEND